MNVSFLKDLLQKILADARYVEGITYGKPRVGHEEGSVANHLAELDATLERIKSLLTEEEYWKLKVLIHVHDTFKLAGKKITGHQVSIRDPNSHASLASKFLAEFTNDESLLAIVQFHDEGHALWKQQQAKGTYNVTRLHEALSHIPDVEFYLIFTVVDGYTLSKLKDRSPKWFLDVVYEHIPPRTTHRAYDALDLLGRQE